MNSYADCGTPEKFDEIREKLSKIRHAKWSTWQPLHVPVNEQDSNWPKRRYLIYLRDVRGYAWASDLDTEIVSKFNLSEVYLGYSSPDLEPACECGAKITNSQGGHSDWCPSK